MTDKITKSYYPGISESQEQMLLIQQCRMQEQIYPDLAGLYSVPNGRFNAKIGSRFKKEGSLSGAADLVLPVARGGWFGFYLEMKKVDKHGKKTNQSPAQKRFEEHVTNRGYKYQVCWSAAEAWDALVEYMGLPLTRTKDDLDEFLKRYDVVRDNIKMISIFYEGEEE